MLVTSYDFLFMTWPFFGLMGCSASWSYGQNRLAGRSVIQCWIGVLDLSRDTRNRGKANNLTIAEMRLSCLFMPCFAQSGHIRHHGMMVRIHLSDCWLAIDQDADWDFIISVLATRTCGAVEPKGSAVQPDGTAPHTCSGVADTIVDLTFGWVLMLGVAVGMYLTDLS